MPHSIQEICDELTDTEGAAALANVSISTWWKWQEFIPCEAVRIGKAVVYRKADVLAWRDERNRRVKAKFINHGKRGRELAGVDG